MPPNAMNKADQKACMVAMEKWMDGDGWGQWSHIASLLWAEAFKAGYEYAKGTDAKRTKDTTPAPAR